MERRIFHVDAFTRTAGKGNAAGVVLDADGMSEEEMLRIAAALGYSETAFVLKPADAGHDVHVRFFTPTVEVPVCGHATVAAHYVRAATQGLEGSFVQKTGAGLQRITASRHGGDWRVAIRQGAPTFGDPVAPALRPRIAAALGIRPDDIAAGLPVQVVSTGHSKVLVPLADVQVLDRLLPDPAALVALGAEVGSKGWFPFAVGQRCTEGRMFAPAIGVAEDPVTGNANGPLGAYLVRHGLMAHDSERLAFEGHQGRALGRDGVVHVDVEIAAGEPAVVTIAGDAVIRRDSAAAAQ
ncbi:PhzF family phenazine biosynthesis isomerase [Pseudoduganella umbonata]|uniref:PhzF family phenazine biosynthesis isomerase n=1 Tax=Pseudoduganella umbonata TaxID=864828 RepID=A0A4P8HLF7_9BURK|nr:PhzF family phenazine biosynthesis isomerase [Pseudoduganella umbonata]MBB3219704.1 PhzF family phenazine biosynthesis protein [Pseudoduganella umbonata]QCP09756.1 PhzF family phenazine biosynthesis isomerase [Pseudoduganella umbonata]